MKFIHHVQCRDGKKFFSFPIFSKPSLTAVVENLSNNHALLLTKDERKLFFSINIPCGSVEWHLRKNIWKCTRDELYGIFSLPKKYFFSRSWPPLKSSSCMLHYSQKSSHECLIAIAFMLQEMMLKFISIFFLHAFEFIHTWDSLTFDQKK